MKKIIFAFVVCLLYAGVANAATFYPLCEPSGGGVPAPCANSTVETSAGLTAWTLPLLNATDIQTAHIGSANGDFSRLQVGYGGLSVFGNTTVSGGLDISQWVTANAAEFGSLSLRSGGSLSFFDNPWSGISATSKGLWFRGSQFLYTKWNGNGACDVKKSLFDSSKTIWIWWDNNGDDHKVVTTAGGSLAGVPVQCLTDN